jgi:hypothetical protein
MKSGCKTGKDMFFGYVICLKTGDESYLLSWKFFSRTNKLLRILKIIINRSVISDFQIQYLVGMCVLFFQLHEENL